ncbi:hypothetical protein SADUNF_Sadunf11G0031400 [Salix dunnii]|uniref:2-carboxy-D-arabinitol-1-phosphatase n=1 Tax=Salix dunnii TaxID=1413687 RepID=A0A835JMA4_9ROSI|nr:hypothetical protein SADUNF_Sadunf11G0031400 [Salix dunnii]
MICGVLTFRAPLSSSSSFTSISKRPAKHSTRLEVQGSNSSPGTPLTAEKIVNDSSITGGAYDFDRATTSLTQKLLSSSKKVTIVRHGLSSWNEESRVQGSSNLSVLTETGVRQAERCRKALENMYFDQCFSSPISRAKNLEAVDAREKYPKEYTTWREDPANFSVNGIYPVQKLWGAAREAWKEILLSPGENFLVITHKSILRALICTALGLSPERFRSIDVNNGGISVFTFNRKGEAMLQSLNMTAHMYNEHIYIY